jgi:hypothetical protein
MNRAARRKMASDIRRAGEEPTFFPPEAWFEYVRHLPRVPLDAPEEPGRRYYLISHHEVDCPSLYTKRFEDCCCDLVYTKSYEPVRS